MEKKKLSGFQLALIAVTAVVSVGALVFGFLQKKSFDSNAKTFKNKSSEMAKIKSMAGFPSQDTVDTLKESLKDYTSTLDSLSKDFERVTISEFTQVSPAEFSSKVSKAKDRLQEMFEKEGVALPENWYLGFEKYTSVPAPKNATGILLYNLEALVWLHEELLKCDPDALLNLYRRPASLELEGGETAASNKKSNNKKSKDESLVVSLPVELSFTAKESKVRDFLNAIAKSNKYLFTIDTVKLKEVSVSDSLSEKDETEPEAESTDEDKFNSLFEDDSTEGSNKPLSNEKLFTQVLGKEKVAVFLDLNLTYLPAQIELTQK